MQKMKQSQRLVFGIVVLSCAIAAIILYPFIHNEVIRQAFIKKVGYLRPVYLTVMYLAQDDRWPDRSLSDLLDNKTKSILVKNGIDWTKIRYFPPTNNTVMLDTDILLSYQEGNHYISVQKNGATRIETSRYRRDVESRGQPLKDNPVNPVKKESADG